MFASIRSLTPVFILALFAITVSLAAKPDRVTTAAGLAAWDQVYSVLISPRCINCHTATNYPQQGDDRHRHFANVVRGPEGKGVPGLNCIGCHQEQNADSTGVPGGPNWHLAPLSMQWQDAERSTLVQCCRLSRGNRSFEERQHGWTSFIKASRGSRACALGVESRPQARRDHAHTAAPLASGIRRRNSYVGRSRHTLSKRKIKSWQRIDSL